MLAPKLTASLGQPIVVDNRAGAGGIVGTAYFAKQPPTVIRGFTTASHTNIPPFNENVPYDPVKDFTHVTSAEFRAGVINPNVPAKNAGAHRAGQEGTRQADLRIRGHRDGEPTPRR